MTALVDVHEPNCTYDVLKAEYEALKARCPEMCETCGGSGWTTFQESHGDPWGSETLTDFCGKCVEQNKCARCGEAITAIEIDLDDHNKCDSCGWSDSPDYNPEMLPQPECWCGSEEAWDY